MAYSVVVWLVDPGEYPQQEMEAERASTGREDAPGASTGANVGYPLPRMVYGVYDGEDEAGSALEEISNKLQQNAPLKISSHAHRQWIIPADRVHYVVCEYVERPKDK
jgi:hypothetical protein